jgi:hypothetical protein
MRMFIRKLAVLTAAFALTLAMSVPSFAAANGSADPVQDKSSDTATIYIGKVLTVAQDNKFPDVTDFNFRMEAVKAWDNANISTAANGKVIPVQEMPLPAASAAEHNKVTVSGTGADIQTGNFAAAQTAGKADTAREKYRSTPVNIKFTKAGYYMYKVNEVSSVPAAIPGMSYDKNSYFVVVYVCNKTDDKGNTTSGVYVHDITSYRNNAGTGYEPDLTDIQNKTDNNNNAALPNDYINLGKVGKTPDEPGTDPDTGNPIGPNKLEAFRFFNDQTTHDVVITNNVTGNLGDVTKEFEYTVTLTGLEKNKLYTTNVDAEDKTDKKATSASAEIETATGGKGTVNSQNKTFTSDADGNATFKIKLADDEVMVLNALPATAKYKVEEHASDHIASYTSESTKPDSWIMVNKSANNTHSDTAISTAEETVDAVSNVTGRGGSGTQENDGTVTVKFRNHRDLVTPTGLPYYGGYTYLLAALTLILAAGAFMSALRRRDEDSEEA